MFRFSRPAFLLGLVVVAPCAARVQAPSAPRVIDPEPSPEAKVKFWLATVWKTNFLAMELIPPQVRVKEAFPIPSALSI